MRYVPSNNLLEVWNLNDLVHYEEIPNELHLEDSLDGFLNALDIGGTGNNRFGISGFNSPDEIAEWFKREDDNGEWRRRD